MEPSASSSDTVRSVSSDRLLSLTHSSLTILEVALVSTRTLMYLLLNMQFISGEKSRAELFSPDAALVSAGLAKSDPSPDFPNAIS